MGASSSSPATAEMKDYITDQISSNKVVVFSKTYCPYCIRTKDLFKKEFSGIDVVYHELDKRGDGPDIQLELLSMSGQRTVPSVWIGGSFVGGNSETQSAFRTGKLQTMLGLN